MSRRDLSDIFRLMTMSVGDLLDDHFETDELKGAFASSGVVGAWAGPYTPGTAYNLLHHDARRDQRRPGRVGARQGRHGRDLRGDRRQRARPRRRDPHGRVRRVDRRHRRARHRRHARERRAAERAARAVGRAPQAHGARPRRRRALPGRGRRGHAPLPHPRRVGEDQRRAVRAAALRARAEGARRAALAREPRDLPVRRLPRARVAGRHSAACRPRGRTSRSRCRPRSTRR